MAATALRTVLTLVAAAAGAALLAPSAGAQIANGRVTFATEPRPELVQFRDFFQFPFSGQTNPDFRPYNPFTPQRPQAYEATRPPPPRKVDTPPASTVIVIGDLFAEWLAYGLEEAFSDTPEIGIARKIKPNSGLVRYESPRPDAPDWSQAVKDLLATEKPAAVVIMLGVNDRQSLRDRTPPPAKPAANTPSSSQAQTSRSSAQSQQTQGGSAAQQGQNSGQGVQSGQPAAETASSDSEQAPAASATDQQRRVVPGGIYEFHTDQWAELYQKRIDEMIAALKSRGVPVVWVGLPAIRGTRSTSDMTYLDDLFRARAEKAGIAYVDIWDGFVDEKGNFTMQGPDFQGQIRRLRTLDGVYFTKPGAEKLARYVERELRRLIANPVMPAALPGPEEQSKGTAAGARPVVGPVVPLSAAGNESGELLGAANRSLPVSSDPVAVRVLSHGEAIAAPPGRADDFSWPRNNANAGDAADTAPLPIETVAPPASPAAKGAGRDAARSDAVKSDAAKADASRADPKKPAAPAARPSPPRASLDGAPPRPPLPVGPSRD